MKQKRRVSTRSLDRASYRLDAAHWLLFNGSPTNQGGRLSMQLDFIDFGTPAHVSLRFLFFLVCRSETTFLLTHSRKRFQPIKLSLIESFVIASSWNDIRSSLI